MYQMRSKLQSKTIRFERIKNYDWGYARSGPIKCDKGFKVRFDLRTPCDNRNDWYGTEFYLIDSQVPLKDYYMRQIPVINKEDPSVHYYGVGPRWPSLYNLKEKWVEYEKVKAKDQ